MIAVERMLTDKSDDKIEIFNLGTGNGVSVLELINTLKRQQVSRCPTRL